MTEKCSGECSSCASAEQCENQKLKQRLSKIKHKIMVLSGKGGVGKSSVAVSLAVSLAREGLEVGLLDIDFHGPSIPTMLGLKPGPVHGDDEGMLPIMVGNLKVMSIGLMTANDKDAIIWRGPMKAGVLKQLLEEVNWGKLDYLIIDFPPGTGDEALSACQLIDGNAGGVIVTTPQQVSVADCRRCASFCRQLNLPIIGVIENMSGFICPDCGKTVNPFGFGGGEQMSSEGEIPFLGRVPLDPEFMKYCDEGKSFVHNQAESGTAKAIAAIIDKIRHHTGA